MIIYTKIKSKYKTLIATYNGYVTNNIHIIKLYRKYNISFHTISVRDYMFSDRDRVGLLFYPISVLNRFYSAFSCVDIFERNYILPSVNLTL
jgi:hypothetical protein